MTHDEAIKVLKRNRGGFRESVFGKALDYAIAELQRERTETVTQFDERVAKLLADIRVPADLHPQD
jgi:hypothetical protein